MRILVIGGTGMLGAPVARRLAAEGWQVRILSRNAPAARRSFPAGFDVVEGDVTALPTLVRAMRGCDAVHVNLRGGNTVASYARIEGDGARNVAAAAARCGIARLGYVSAAGIGDPAVRHPVFAVKAAAVAAIAGSGVPYTVFRPTHFMESLPQFVRHGTATVLGRQPHRYHYLAAQDFAAAVARAYGARQAAGQEYTMFGPEAWTMAEALRTYCAGFHPGMRVHSLPLAVARLVAAITRNADLRFAALLFEGFAEMGERGDPAPADALFGRARTTLADWCQGAAARPAVPSP